MSFVKVGPPNSLISHCDSELRPGIKVCILADLWNWKTLLRDLIIRMGQRMWGADNTYYG
jgi:hypothetical protein